jgi:hypothetical protein
MDKRKYPRIGVRDSGVSCRPLGERHAAPGAKISHSLTNNRGSTRRCAMRRLDAGKRCGSGPQVAESPRKGGGGDLPATGPPRVGMPRPVGGGWFRGHDSAILTIWVLFRSGVRSRRDRQPEFIKVTPSAHGSSGADRRATFQNRPSYGRLTLDCEMKRYRSFETRMESCGRG